MLDWLGFGKHLERNRQKQRVVKYVCMWTTDVHSTCLNFDLLFVAQSGRTAASQNHPSCQFADKWAKWATMMKAMSFCVWSALVRKLWLVKGFYEKEEMKWLFWLSVSWLSHTQRYIREYFCELLVNWNFFCHPYIENTTALSDIHMHT